MLARRTLPRMQAMRQFASSDKLFHHTLAAPEFTAWETENRTSLVFTLSETHGILNKALNIFTNNHINLTRIQSKPEKFIHNDWRKVDFHVDFDGSLDQPHVQKAVRQLKLIADEVEIIGTLEVPWFPTRIEDFNVVGKQILGEGDGI